MPWVLVVSCLCKLNLDARHLGTAFLRMYQGKVCATCINLQHATWEQPFWGCTKVKSVQHGLTYSMPGDIFSLTEPSWLTGHWIVIKVTVTVGESGLGCCWPCCLIRLVHSGWVLKASFCFRLQKVLCWFSECQLIRCLQLLMYCWWWLTYSGVCTGGQQPEGT